MFDGIARGREKYVGNNNSPTVLIANNLIVSPAYRDEG
jgi:hypothetical protein